jgi:hypothetical protein
MRGRILLTGFVFGLLGLGAPACGSATTTPTSPSPTLTSTFNGTLTLNGSLTFTFDVATAGTITSTLTLGPASTSPLGMDLGLLSGQSCVAKVSNDTSFQGTIVTGQLSGATTMCVRIYDSKSNVVTPLTFQVDVVHP